MSKHVDHLNRPLTDEERAWLVSRREEWKIERNDMIFKGKDSDPSDGREDPTSSPGDVPSDGSGPEGQAEEPALITMDQIHELKVDELRTELRELDIEPEGNKDELRIQLADAYRERGWLAE